MAEVEQSTEASCSTPATLYDTNVIVMGGYQLTENSFVLLDDVWLFGGDKEVWNDINVFNHEHASPLKWILYSVAVQTQDTDSKKCARKESVFFFTNRNRTLSAQVYEKERQVYEWKMGTFISPVHNNCLMETISI